MSIANYSQLRSAVADWLNRSDLTAVIPSFIALAEAGFNKEERLRLKPSITRADATFDGQYEALPADYLEMLNLEILASNPDHRKLQFITLNQFDEYQQTFTNNGLPLYYTIIGNQLRILPFPDTSYTAEMIYYAKIPALSDSNTTNWLLTNHPDIYLYGTLMQSAPYLKDDARTATWAQLYEQALDNAHQADDRALFAGAILKARAKPF